MTAGDLCDCQHSSNDHVLVATQEDPLQGGIRLCPSNGCDCFSTWSANGATRDSVVIPPRHQVGQLRAQIQAGS